MLKKEDLEKIIQLHMIDIVNNFKHEFSDNVIKIIKEESTRALTKVLQEWINHSLLPEVFTAMAGCNKKLTSLSEAMKNKK